MFSAEGAIAELLRRNNGGPMKKSIKITTGLVAIVSSVSLLTGCAGFGAPPPTVTGSEAMAMANETPSEVLRLVAIYSAQTANKDGFTETYTSSKFPKSVGIYSFEPKGTSYLSAWVGGSASLYSLHSDNFLGGYASILTPTQTDLPTVTRDGEWFKISNPEWYVQVEEIRVLDGLIKEIKKTYSTGEVTKGNVDYFVTEQARALFASATPKPEPTINGDNIKLVP